MNSVTHALVFTPCTVTFIVTQCGIEEQFRPRGCYGTIASARLPTVHLTFYESGRNLTTEESTAKDVCVCYLSVESTRLIPMWVILTDSTNAVENVLSVGISIKLQVTQVVYIRACASVMVPGVWSASIRTNPFKESSDDRHSARASRIFYLPDNAKVDAV